MLDNVIASGKFFTDNSNAVALVLAATAVFLLMSSWRRKQRRSEPKPTPKQESPLHQRPPAVPKTQGLGRDIEALIVELQEFSRKVSADIDTRFAKLEAVIRDADRRIAVLHRLTQQAQDPTGGNAAQSSDPQDRHTIVYELADAGFSPVEIAKDLGKTPGEIELILNLRKSADKGLS